MSMSAELGDLSATAFAAAPLLASLLLLVVVRLIRPVRGAVTEQAR